MSKKDWAFIQDPTVDVYNFTKNHYKKFSAKKKKEIKRKSIAKLLFGEWVKRIRKNGEFFTAEGQAYVAFRGGLGWVPDTSFDSEKRTLEIYFLDVGQGDGILIQTPDERRYLIDGGPNEREGALAHDFLRWKYNLDENKIDFDAIIMTHADADHSMGLVPILNDEKIIVKNFYHNGLVRYNSKTHDGNVTGRGKQRKITGIVNNILKEVKKEKLSTDYEDLFDALTTAKKRYGKMKIKSLNNNSKKIKLQDGIFEIEILGPINIGTKKNPAYAAIGDAGKIRNGNSVSLMITYGKCKILLCGDLNKEYESGFVRFHQDKNNPLNAHIFKANHHGSQEITEDFLRKVEPWISVISSGDDRDYAHPRAKLLGLLGRYSSHCSKEPIVFSTEVARTYHPLKKSEMEIMKKATKIIKKQHIKKSEEKDYANIKQILKKDSYYSKAIDGVIHVRTNGERLVVGRVYGKYKTKREGENVISRNYNKYDWEYYPFDL